MVASTQGGPRGVQDENGIEHLTPIEKAAQDDILDDRVTAEQETPEQSTDELIARLAQAEAETEKLKGDYLRALADVENTRRRAARDRDDANRYAITKFASGMLSVADNLRRALDSIDDAARAENSALQSLLDGIEMTEKELMSVFEQYGVTKIDAEGSMFDPHVHEAMFEIPNESVPTGTIVHVVREGYMLHDRVLRPAQVGVSKGGPKTPVPEENPPEASEADPRENAEADMQGEPAAAARSSAEAYEKSTEPCTPKTGANVDRTT